jgi:hypothetical protein
VGVGQMTALGGWASSAMGAAFWVASLLPLRFPYLLFFFVSSFCVGRSNLMFFLQKFFVTFLL